MDDTEAEAVLVALHDPLDWHELVDPADDNPEYWQSVHLITQNRRYIFTLTPLGNDALRFDKEGTPLSWGLWIGLQEIGGTADKLVSWGFPVPTFEGGKAACARLAVTGNFTEMAALEKRWYTLEWKPPGIYGDGLPRETEGVSAAVVRQEGSGWYTAVAKKQWLSKCFLAQYTVQFPEENHAEPQEAYLERQNLRPPSTSPRRYRTQEEAKAACEHHHATGRWNFDA